MALTIRPRSTQTIFRNNSVVIQIYRTVYYVISKLFWLPQHKTPSRSITLWTVLWPNIRQCMLRIV